MKQDEKSLGPIYEQRVLSGVGARGYNRDAATRQGYGLTERDDATGLDHTWFRKNESSAGRWTSPDPYKGSMNLTDPQSFNRYSYVQNQPTNFVDPSGLQMAFCATYVYGKEYKFADGTVIQVPEGTYTVCFGGGPPETGPPNPGPGSSGGGNGKEAAQASENEKEKQQRAVEACARAKIRRARRQAAADAIKNHVTLAEVGLSVAAALVGGVQGKVGASIGGAFLSPEVRAIGERAVSPQILRGLDDCRRNSPAGVLDALVIVRLAVTTGV